MNVNPQAANMDPRWPLDSVDLVYVIEHSGIWELKDFFGNVIVSSDNRSVCFFKVMELGVKFLMRH